MKKRRRMDRDNPHDNPLGIGLSTKTLVLIGVGLVGVIALKVYLDKKKRAAGAPGTAPQPLGTPPSHDPIGLGVPSTDPNGMMNGFAGHTPASNAAPASEPGPTTEFGTAPASPPTGRRANGANYDKAGGFSGMGDGELNGRNSRM